jgi:hypothetical protein
MRPIGCEQGTPCAARLSSVPRPAPDSDYGESQSLIVSAGRPRRSWWRQLGGAAATAMAAAVSLSCAGGGAVQVSVLLAPHTTFSDQRTYRFLPVPESRAAQPDAPSIDDPMLENSISGREVRHDITQALTARGYVHHRDTADLAVAYYIGSRSALVVTNYDYGYDPKMAQSSIAQDPTPASEYTYEQGTVIVDVLDGGAKHILWRGLGRADLPTDPRQFAHSLDVTVHAIMQKFPGRAAAGAVAGR